VEHPAGQSADHRACSVEAGALPLPPKVWVLPSLPPLRLPLPAPAPLSPRLRGGADEPLRCSVDGLGSFSMAPSCSFTVLSSMGEEVSGLTLGLRRASRSSSPQS